MRFVETVTGKLDDQFKNVVCFLFSQSICGRPGNEVRSELAEILLFANRFDARIRIAQRYVAEAIQDLHNLFLIDHHAVCFGQHCF